VSAEPAKRFYSSVTVDDTGDGFQVALDGRAITTPARQRLPLPSKALADAIAAEWDAQQQYIHPDTMPLMKLAATLKDRVTPQRELVIDGVVRFAETDLLCYRAEDPPELRRRQDAVWQPVLDWAAGRHGISLEVVTGVLPRSQSLAAVAAVSKAVEARTDPALTALQAATQTSGSVVLGLALVDGHLTPEEAFAAAHVDETYQAEHWGTDAEAEAARGRNRTDLAAAKRFLDLVG